jgi:hypothetical protein
MLALLIICYFRPSRKEFTITMRRDDGKFTNEDKQFLSDMAKKMSGK